MCMKQDYTQRTKRKNGQPLVTRFSKTICLRLQIVAAIFKTLDPVVGFFLVFG